MKIAKLSLMCLCGLIANTWAAKPKVQDRSLLLEQQKNQLAQRLTELEDSLQTETEARWNLRQSLAKESELEQQKIVALEQQLQQSQQETARKKEEALVIQASLAEAQKKVEAKQQSVQAFSGLVEESLRKEADVLGESFPLDMEKNRKEFEGLRQKWTKNPHAEMQIMAGLPGWQIQKVREGQVIQRQSATMISPAGDLADVKLLRLGHVLAFGVDGSQNVFLIRQTGMTGMDRYVTDSLNEPQSILAVQAALLSSENNKIPVDVLQNHQTGAILTGKAKTWVDEFHHLMEAGGWMMWPILVTGILGVLIILRKFVQYLWNMRRMRSAYRAIRPLLEEGDFVGAEKKLSKSPCVITRVLHAGIQQREMGRPAAENAIREVLAQEVPTLESNLSTLSVLATAAPLLGLLGTVTGMITLFKAITEYGTGDPKMLAGGISEALICTGAGLFVAIPLLLLHNWLNNRNFTLQAEMNKNALRILNRLWPEGA
jgi:biopolymer transport protein ExbB